MSRYNPYGTSDNSFPCKECKERKVGCHSTCSKYLKSKMENDKRLEKLYKERNINDAFIELNKGVRK